MDNNTHNFIEHLLDLTKRLEIKWGIIERTHNVGRFDATLNEYTITIKLEKNGIRISMFIIFNYNGNRNLEIDSKYFMNCDEHILLVDLKNTIFEETQFTWAIKKTSVIDGFMEDTGVAFLRDKRIDDILDD